MRGVFLAALMVVSVFAGSIAFAGSAAAQDVTDATRSIDSTQVQPGETVQVTVDVTLSEGGSIQIADNFNEELDVTIADGFGGLDNVNNGTVTFNNPTGTSSSYSVTYNVTVPSNATPGTSYAFDGTAQSNNQTAITGDSQITVAEVEGTRTLEHTTAYPGQTIAVSIDADLPQAGGIQIVDNADPALNATIIDGFGSLDNVQNGTVTFNNPVGTSSSYTATYEVTVPSNATNGTVYNFDGYVQADADTAITGDSRLTVETALPNFTVSNLDDISVTDGSSIDVPVTVTNAGGLAGNQTVELRVNGTVQATRTVDLDPGDWTNVTFTVDTDGLDPGTYTYGVYTEDANRTATLTVEAYYTDYVNDQNMVTDAGLNDAISSYLSSGGLDSAQFNAVISAYLTEEPIA